MQLLAKGNPNWPQAFYNMKVNIGLYSKCYVSFEYFVVINCIHTFAHTRQHDLRNLTSALQRAVGGGAVIINYGAEIKLFGG